MPRVTETTKTKTLTRVTRRACEKIAKMKSNPSKLFLYFSVVNYIAAKMFGYFCNFGQPAQSEQAPNGRKFAQSGHPDADIQQFKHQQQ
jgi:hypothetical protein